jgi:hypothetical protein
MYRSDAGDYYRARKIGGEDSLGEILLQRRREADESAS